MAVNPEEDPWNDADCHELDDDHDGRFDAKLLREARGEDIQLMRKIGV